MTEDKPKPPTEDFDSRLREARKRFEVDHPSPKAERPEGMQRGIALAARIGTELVAAIVVAVGIGLLLDKWLDTKPWFLITFVILGAGAGMMNVFRLANKLGGTAGYNRPPDGPKED